MLRLVILLLLAFVVVAEEDQPLAPAFVARLNDATKSLSAGDGSAFNAFWNTERFGNLILRGVTLDAKERRDFIAGLKSLVWGDVLVKNCHESGSYLLLRSYRREGKVHALFRMINNDSTINYHDTEFTSDGPDACITDVYVFTSGELFSETMRNVVVPLLASKKGFDLGKFLGLGDSDGLTAFKKMTNLFQKGDYAGALEAYSSMPDSIKKTKGIMMMRMRAAQKMDTETYMTAIRDLIAAFPNEAAFEFMMIDGYQLTKQFDKAIGCIDKLDRAVGGDPYLDSLRASVLLDAGRLAEARSKAEACVDRLPDVVHGWWMLVTATLRQKDHRATAELLLSMQKRFRLEFGDLTDVDEYKNFVTSPEYKEWMKSKSSIVPVP